MCRTDLYGQLQDGEDVLHFGLELLWSEFAFSDSHLVGEENHLREKETSDGLWTTLLLQRHLEESVSPCSRPGVKQRASAGSQEKGFYNRAEFS